MSVPRGKAMKTWFQKYFGEFIDKINVDRKKRSKNTSKE